MIGRENVLLVDDEATWRNIYEKSVSKLDVDSIRTAGNLTDAERAIDVMKFAVAIIDIGLDKFDETNVGGLSVMEKLRSVGDNTSIVVITGRSGDDVIDVVSQSIQRYGATATLAKGKLDSSLLRISVENGLSAYREKMAELSFPVHQALLPKGTAMSWDDMMMGVLGIKQGVRVLYDFLERLLGRYLPLIGGSNDTPIGAELADGVAYGMYWSRAIGDAVIVSIGQQPAVDQAAIKAASEGLLHERYHVGGLLSEYGTGSSKGLVYALMDRDRSQFDQLTG